MFQSLLSSIDWHAFYISAILVHLALFLYHLESFKHDLLTLLLNFYLGYLCIYPLSKLGLRLRLLKLRPLWPKRRRKERKLGRLGALGSRWAAAGPRNGRRFIKVVFKHCHQQQDLNHLVILQLEPFWRLHQFLLNLVCSARISSALQSMPFYLAYFEQILHHFIYVAPYPFLIFAVVYFQ